MSQEIHYEVFRRLGSKGAWALLDVVTDRDHALRLAEEMMKDEKATGVKVVKETYHPDTGDYLSLKIFEDGHTKMKVQQAAEDMPHALPCFQPDDLYSYHARTTIARLLSDFLGRNRWTVTELIHRADALEKLEATGTLYQHAIQKISVAQAASTSTPVQQIIKSLNDLATKAIHRVYRDERRKYFPDVPDGRFGAVASRLAGESDGAYILNGAIARYLKPAKAWDEKLAALLALMKDIPAEGPGRLLLLSSIDAITAEMLNGSAALHELIGTRDCLGEALLALVQLFTGEETGSQAGIIALAHYFAGDELAEARTAIANRILAEMKSVRRLSHVSAMDELKQLRRVAGRLVLAQGKYLSHEDLIVAFTLRSKRLVTHESIGEHLADAKEPDEKIDRLLLIEENIIGAENKRQLATFIMPVLLSNSFEQHFLLGKAPPVQRMQRLAELQARVRRSTFQEKERQEIGDFLDKLACEVETRGRVLEAIEAKSSGHVESAINLLRLCTGGMVTEGRLSTKTRDMIMSHLGKPGFLTGYVAHVSRGAKPDADGAMKELMGSLSKAGIAPENGLKSIAA